MSPENRSIKIFVYDPNPGISEILFKLITFTLIVFSGPSSAVFGNFLGDFQSILGQKDGLYVDKNKANDKRCI